MFSIEGYGVSCQQSVDTQNETMQIWTSSQGSGEAAHRLRLCSVLIEDCRLSLSTCIRQLIVTYNLGPRDPVLSSGVCRHFICVHKLTLSHFLICREACSEVITILDVEKQLSSCSAYMNWKHIFELFDKNHFSSASSVLLNGLFRDVSPITKNCDKLAQMSQVLFLCTTYSLLCIHIYPVYIWRLEFLPGTGAHIFARLFLNSLSFYCLLQHLSVVQGTPLSSAFTWVLGIWVNVLVFA